MTQTLIEQASSLQVGIVDFVSPDEIKVTLDIESPDSVALNTGGPRPFPRVNGYLLIPVDQRLLVGQIEWITVERSPFPKRRGMQDFGLVDLPYPIRRLKLNPLGTLWAKHEAKDFVFTRGSELLPSIGTPALLPTNEQLRAIIESGQKGRVCIGTSPLANGAKVYVDPDRLFGRHLAVLGNTGSGKSCTVAGLIRWCLEEADRSKRDNNHEQEEMPNARFIVLDPNGEYTRAFSKDDPTAFARIFKVNPGEEEYPLKVPLWFWNSAEWCAFTQASAKTQRPALIHALRWVREGVAEPAPDKSHEMRRFLRTLVTIIRAEMNAGNPWGNFPKPKSFYEKLSKWKTSLESEIDSFEGDRKSSLQNLVEEIKRLCDARSGQYAHYDFTREEIKNLLSLTRKAHSAFGGSESEIFPVDVDAPRPFKGASLVRAVEASGEILSVSDHVEPLLVRIRALLGDSRMKPIMDVAEDTNLEEWLNNYIGNDCKECSCVAVLDLSLIPTEVVHIITAVIARMIFEALQRYVKLNGKAMPTVLVMEEAHTFIKRYKEDFDFQDAASICCQVFERIAREGRKFGLGLVLSSQRPSELSPTVLSQCNTFLLHRISNDRDQDMLHRLVPDNLRGLLRELPSLPSQHAIITGWATELPVLVKIRELPESQRPQSEDPDFWDVWIGRNEQGEKVDRKVNWKEIADDWQQSNSQDQDQEEE